MTENSFVLGLTYKKVLPLAQYFLRLNLQKNVFQFLPFHIYTQFAEQIAIDIHLQKWIEQSFL